MAVLAECHSRDHDKTRLLLAREQLHWAPRALDVADTERKEAETIERPSLLNIAESYELMEFAGHSACQTKLSIIWNGRLSLYTKTWKVGIIYRATFFSGLDIKHLMSQFLCQCPVRGPICMKSK